jgi:peptidoglycan/xylan/chitin deacetylase (PgdA/CDA1 family)
MEYIILGVMDSLSGFVVIVIICCIALLSLSLLLLLSTTEVTYSQLPYFPHNQQLLLSNNSQVNATIKNESRDQIGSSKVIIEHKFNVTNTPKVAILTFGDGWKSQFTNAKPILDKYGFKASFFVTCDRVGRPAKMTWQDLVALYKEGHDIESKTMTAPRLTNVSADQLNFEVGESKRCLSDHGMSPTVFATPHGKGSDNATVVNAISRYYDLAINGFSNLMFLHCDGWKISSPNQTDCRTYYDNGTLTYANRYVVREWSHNHQDVAYAHNNNKIFQIFVQIVNNQTAYNGNGTIDAIPILAYHRIGETITSPSDSTDLALFAEEMKYLHDNGFKIIRVPDLGYDDKTKDLYIKRLR